jgi:1,3-beta-glucanosyltransferase GAS1
VLITIRQGSKFFYKSNGTQFIVKGVVYKTPGFSSPRVGDLASFIDPLTDDRICRQDIRRLANLGINTLLVTGFNADRDQRACMQLFSDAEIYVLVIINGDSEITQQINGSVGTPVGYTSVNHFFRGLDFFQKWNNTLGLAFFLQDFTRLSDHPAEVLPLQKGYLGDIKEYMKSRGYRSIPLGVIGSEHTTKGFNIPQYMACGDDSTAADFYATWPRCLDLDQWCLNASAHYSDLRDTFHDYHRPLILAEGCRRGKTFGFEWIRELYSPLMTDIFSGAIFHSWLASPDENENPDDLKKCPDYLCK